MERNPDDTLIACAKEAFDCGLARSNRSGVYVVKYKGQPYKCMSGKGMWEKIGHAKNAIIQELKYARVPTKEEYFIRRWDGKRPPSGEEASAMLNLLLESGDLVIEKLA